MAYEGWSPYNRGYSAFFNGDEIITNPYNAGTDDYDKWHSGYIEAQEDDSYGSADLYGEDMELSDLDAVYDGPLDDDDNY